MDIAKKARARGPTGMQLWALSTGAIMYGFYRVGQHNTEQNGIKLEDRKARYALAPVLQAEEDAMYLLREKAIKDREAEIMKNVPGFQPGASVYYTDRWVPRNVAPLDKNTKK